MIHFSVNRKGYNSDFYKPICTMVWTLETEFNEKPNFGGWQRKKKPMHFSAAPFNVTCAECLIKLIDKKSNELEKLKEKLAFLESNK